MMNDGHSLPLLSKVANPWLEIFGVWLINSFLIELKAMFDSSNK